MIEVNAMGDACPIPVVKTLNAMKKLNGADTVQTLVDNKTAVENLTRLAESMGCAIEPERQEMLCAALGMAKLDHGGCFVPETF